MQSVKLWSSLQSVSTPNQVEYRIESWEADRVGLKSSFMFCKEYIGVHVLFCCLVWGYTICFWIMFTDGWSLILNSHLSS
ncbi:hypothetical protein AQUCO_02100042v1 [Aquilegia coerulea]|uniref:Uncharacterized protein n=1 Tax=Aquilegia coerulea TaxID=218851 RepID=A0A2G5DEH7_AQUCA|nr:hypothetical protein AQUCO_02100042v1 [Aquilegia coerulea]